MSRLHLIPTVYFLPLFAPEVLKLTHLPVESFNLPILLLTSAITCWLGNSHRNRLVHEGGRCPAVEVIFKAGFYLYSAMSNPGRCPLPD